MKPQNPLKASPQAEAKLGIAPAPLRVLCDVDGVLANFVEACLRYAEAKHGVHMSEEAVTEWEHGQAIGIPTLIEEMRRDPGIAGLCRAMRAYPEAKAFWDALCKHPRVGVVFAATVPFCAEWLTPRAQWLERFGVPLAQQKHLFQKDGLAGGAAGWHVLLDDKPKNCEAFVAAGGKAYLIARPYNTNSTFDGPRGGYGDCLRWLSMI